MFAASTEVHKLIRAAGIPVVSVNFATRSMTFDGAAPEQVAQAEAIMAAFDVAKARHNADIDAQIAAKEASVTPRMLREAALGIDTARLRAKDDEIKALREGRR